MIITAKSLFCSILIYFALNLNPVMIDAQEFNIGIFTDRNPQKLFIESPTGNYKIKAGNKTIARLKQDRSVILSVAKGLINISNEKKDYGLYKEIKIQSRKYSYNKAHDKKGSKKNAEIVIKLIEPKVNARTYQGNFNVLAGEKKLLLINQVALPDYLAGVVESESGSKAELEYYKNQAIISRTYAYKNSKNHQKEAYQLCDGVHCQAYKGKSTSNDNIQKAVKKTGGKVIVDEKNNLIDAVFSANCGGQTNNSADVWSDVPYLKSITDKYCIDQPQARWSKKISFVDFKNFLKEKKLIIPDTLSIDSFAFSQPSRKFLFTVLNQEIKLTQIRSGLGLRSTFFEIKPNGKELMLEGRGYGHGVGMCQEGAMNMARKGFKYDEIIRFYYQNVKIISLDKL